jgi:cobalamin biosynthetic protein CobC
MSNAPRDHGGGLDGAAMLYGGARNDWIDLSTGINPVPYPIGEFTQNDWTALPDAAAFNALTQAARSFWNVPDGAAILPAPGASALIARIPALATAARVDIPKPTYNEHAAAFQAQGWTLSQDNPSAHVLVHRTTLMAAFGQTAMQMPRSPLLTRVFVTLRQTRASFILRNVTA